VSPMSVEEWGNLWEQSTPLSTWRLESGIAAMHDHARPNSVFELYLPPTWLLTHIRPAKRFSAV
jgi:ABC-type transport system involved in cytochrome c biogenesis permease subunit